MVSTLSTRLDYALLTQCLCTISMKCLTVECSQFEILLLRYLNLQVTTVLVLKYLFHEEKLNSFHPSLRTSVFCYMVDFRVR